MYEYGHVHGSSLHMLRSEVNLGYWTLPFHLLFAAVYCKLAGFDVPPSPSSILLYPVLGHRFVLLSPVLRGFWGSKSRVLTLSPSSHFSRPQCSFYWLKKEIMSAGCHSFWKLCWRILLLHLCMCVYSCVNCCGGQRSSSGSCLWRLLPLFWSRAIPLRPESRLSWPRSLRDPPPFTQPWLWDDRCMPPHPAS